MGLLEQTIEGIEGQDVSWRSTARSRLEQLLMPPWALGRLMDLAEDLAGMTRSMDPPLDRKAVVVMAGDHGVVAEGVSGYPQAITAQMMGHFATGEAGINALAGACGARVVPVDMGVATGVAVEGVVCKRVGAGTGNIVTGPAMGREDAVRCLEAGIEVVLEMRDAVDLFGVGDMGIGNTTPSAAIAAVLTGRSVMDVTGRGAGMDDVGMKRKVLVVERALDLNRPDPGDGVDVLSKVGGFEIGGIAGAILGAAFLKRPVLIDGFISSAGAMIAKVIAPESAEYMIAAHRSVEPGHRAMLAFLNKKPLLDLDLRLGEGTGCALAMPLVTAAGRLLTDVLTFEEAGVPGATG